MRRFMERFSAIVARYPDRPALKDGIETITYRELDLESGRVYRFLKDHGIGKEQFVTIYLKKNVHFASAMLGASKAGAAYILIEEGYPGERVAYIKRDSGSVFTIDEKLMEKILRDCEFLPGYEKTGLHDAAYAVYTSGSTGNPKGVLHEFGNLDQCAATAPEQDEYEECIFGFPASLNFVATQLYLLPAFSTAATVFLISGDNMRDPNRLQELLLDQKIESIFLPPSYLRHYHNPSPYLKHISTGSEPAYGIYYPNGPVVECVYAMSETGFFVFRGVLEKSFENAPVGWPVLDMDLYLLDDDDNIVKGDGEGELCFENEYVRGYLNLPEQTKKSFRPMKGHPQTILFHTNDIVRRGEDGRYYIVGRKDDMIKIDGNRIEPGEIEAKVKEVTGLEDVMAKGFLERNRAYIAVYFLREDAAAKGIFDGKTLSIDRERLSMLLPSYMLPTYYVPLDTFPLNANGKMSRKDLPAPDFSEMRDDYVPPETELECYICEKMAEVLKLEQVGVTEDFFVAGGDSMRAIELVTVCDRLRISTKEIYRERTARKLAGVCFFAEENTLACGLQSDMDPGKTYPLLPGQYIHAVYLAYLKYPASINMAKLYRMNDSVDTKRLCDAVDDCIKAHPALQTCIFKAEDATFWQRYEPSFFRPVQVIELTDEAWRKKLQDKDEAFDLEDSPLFRCTVYVAEGSVWLWLSIHHIIADGMSMKILLNDIYRRYEDESYQPRPDTYFSILAENEAARGGVTWKTAEAYYENLFRDELGKTIPYGLRLDSDSKDRNSKLYMEPDAFVRKSKRDGVFFLTAFALAECWYNESQKAVVASTYADRGDADRMAACGFLIIPLPVLLDISDSPSPEEMLERILEQMEFGMSHTEYSFLYEKLKDISEMPRFIYQKDTLSEGEISAIASPGPDIVCHREIGGVFSLNVIDNSESETLGIAIHYSADNYESKSVERFAELFKKAVDLLSDV